MGAHLGFCFWGTWVTHTPIHLGTFRFLQSICIWMAGRVRVTFFFLFCKLKLGWEGFSHMGSLWDGVWPRTSTALWGEFARLSGHLMNDAMMVFFCCMMRSWTGLELGTHNGALLLRDTPVFGPRFLETGSSTPHTLGGGGFTMTKWLFCSNTNHPISGPFLATSHHLTCSPLICSH